MTDASLQQRFFSSEAHRAACEARYVQHLSPEMREHFLAGVAKRRGEACAQDLRTRVWELEHPR